MITTNSNLSFFFVSSFHQPFGAERFLFSDAKCEMWLTFGEKGKRKGSEEVYVINDEVGGVERGNCGAPWGRW